jgi:hypothetical protein
LRMIDSIWNHRLLFPQARAALTPFRRDWRRSRIWATAL